MGIGSALGSMVDGYNSASANRRNEEKMDMARTAQAQNQEFNAMKMDMMKEDREAQKQAYASSQTPEAKQYRAAKMKAETEKYKMQAGFFNDMSSDAAQLQETQNELTQVKMDFENKADVDHTVETKNNMYTIIGDGGQIGDNELNQFNSIIEANPEFLKKSFPNPVVLVNPNNKKHEQGLNEYAAKLLEGQGLDMTKFPADKADEIMEDTLDSVKELARVGYIVVDNETGTAKSIDSLFGQLGNNERTPSTLTSKVSSVVRSTAEKAATKNMNKRKLGLNEVPEWQKEDTTGMSETKGPKLYKGRDANRDTMRFQALNIKIPPELEAINKYNAELINPKDGKAKESGFWAGATTEQVQEGVQNQLFSLMELEVGDEAAREDLTAKAQAGISLMKDEGQRKQMRAALKKTEQMAVGKEFVFSDDISTGKQNRIDIMESNNLDSTPTLVKAKDKITAELTLMDGIDEVSRDIIEVEKSEGMLNQAMASPLLMKAMGIAPETATTLMSALTDKSAKVTRAMINNTIPINSKLGKLLATYVKNTSGASVSDDERTFLSGVLMGATGGDSVQMIRALTAFKEASETELGGKLSDMSLIAGIPSTMRRVNNTINSEENFISEVEQARASRKPSEVTNTVTTDNPHGLSPEDLEIAKGGIM